MLAIAVRVLFAVDACMLVLLLMNPRKKKSFLNHSIYVGGTAFMRLIFFFF